MASVDPTPETSVLVKYHTTSSKNYIRVEFADHDDEAQTEQIDASEAEAEPTAEQLAEMEAADAAAATETPEADPEEKE